MSLAKFGAHLRFKEKLLMVYLRFTFVYREKKAGLQGKKKHVFTVLSGN